MKRSMFVALAAVCTPLALAQSPEDSVVVTATRLPQARSQTLQPVNIITGEDIARSGQQTLVEILQTLGGAEITSTGGTGQPSGVFLRGANSGHTLVLVDGIRISSATAGTTALENIPLSQIERIEIVPGQLSSLYGSDAIGGVIQIFTKGGQGAPETSVSAGGGTYGTRAVDGGVNRTVDRTDFSLSTGYFETRGFDATKSAIPFGLHNPDLDGYRNVNFSAKIAHHFDPGNDWGLTVFRSEGTTRFDNGPTTNDINRQTLSAYSLHSSNRITRTWRSLVRVGEGADDSSVTGAFPGFFRTTQPQLTWQNDVVLGPGIAIAGVEYLKQHVESDTAYVKTDRTIGSAFTGYGGEYGQHGWQANLREDDNSQFGRRTTGSLGYAYRLTPDLRFRVGAGNAFKAPTFNDLYFPGFNNPNLRPEKSRSAEAGVNYSMGAGRFSATYFENRITDLIVFDPVTSTPQNLDRARIAGAELAYRGAWAGLSASAKLTLQNPVDADTGKLLQRRAREFGSLAFTETSGHWRLAVEVVASGARFDSNDEDAATRMHGYALVNLSASYAIHRDWLVRARWGNVLGREYELAQYYNTPGSNIFVSLQYQTQ